MIEQISGAQAEIEHHLTELRRAASAGGDATPLLQADAQREGLGRLQHRIAQAHGAGLVSIRAEVSAFVAAAQAVAQQVRTVAATAQAAETALHAASEAAHREVTDFVRDFYEKKIFDPYLRFASAEDEEAYRKREEDYQRDIKAALALGTPEGDLLAARLERKQLLDAGAHGADRSPEYAARVDRVETVIGRLDATIGSVADQAPNEVDAALGDTPAPSTSASDPVAVAVRLLASGVAVGEGDGGHGLTGKDAPKAASPARK